jgi:threonine aldolase
MIELMLRRNFFATPLAAFQLSAEASENRVYAIGDGVRHTPESYARLLASLTSGGKVAPDDYSRGGIVEELETRMASLLGKEAAVWLPTGTLANHLAIRLLAGTRRRALVQAESHLYMDCGDCAQTLSGLNLIPLARGRATFTLEEVQQAANDAAEGRVVTQIGAIQIETPVRRRSGETFDFAQIEKISEWARARRIGMHLDGARLFLEAAYTRRRLSQYTELFDTVYVSLYKYFNAAAGAILAGPKQLLDGLYHTRRMFGGGLPHVWPYAAVALHYVDGFQERFGKAVKTAESVISTLQKDSNFELRRISNGTNIFEMRTTGVNPPVYQGRLESAGISVKPPAAGEWFSLQVNETWMRASAEEITARFQRALT